MSQLFSYKLGLTALIATARVILATVIFIILEQTNQIPPLQETLHNLCTQALLDTENTNSTAEYVSTQ